MSEDTRQAFIEEACKYIMSGQSVMYVNSSEEHRLVKAIRHAGWLMTPAPDDPHPAVYPETPQGQSQADWLQVEAAKERIAKALTFAGAEKGAVQAYLQKRVVDPRVFIAALEELDRMPADDAETANAVGDAADALREVLDHTGYRTYVWNQNEGFEHDNSYADELKAAIQSVGDAHNGMTQRCLVVFKDAHMHINTNEGPAWRRAIRNVYEDNRLVANGLARHLFFVQCYLKPHPDVAHCFAKLSFARPNDHEIDAEIGNVQQGIVDAASRDCAPELRAELVRSLRGLDTTNITKALSLCIVENKGFHPRMVRRVRSMRSQQLAAGQGLRIVDPDDPELLMLGDLGGYENVRELIDAVVLCRHPEAVAVDLRAPTGFGLAGPPGCLHPDTPIHDPSDGTTKTVLQRYEEGKDFSVKALDEASGQLVTAKAEAPCKYPAAPMLKFTLADGNQITVTHGHRFWDGEKYITAAEVAGALRRGERVRLPTVSDGAP